MESMTYRQYVDAGLVLFGQPFNHQFPPTRHPVDIVDDCLVVHQQVKRHGHHKSTQAQRKQSFQLQANLSKQSHRPKQEELPNHKPFHLRQQALNGIEGYEHPNEEEQHQHFGTDIEEYLPQQFGIVLSKDQAYQDQENLIDHIPFPEGEPQKKREEEGEAIQQGDENQVDMEIEEVAEGMLEQMLPV